jgi:hypothetical protein
MLTLNFMKKHTPPLIGTSDTTTKNPARAKTKKQILHHLHSGRNIFIFSPRGWGKHTLVRSIAETYTCSNTNKYFELDISKVSNEEEMRERIISGLEEIPGLRWVHSNSVSVHLSDLIEVFAANNHLRFLICLKGLEHNKLKAGNLRLTSALTRYWEVHSNCRYLLLCQSSESFLSNAILKRIHLGQKTRKIRLDCFSSEEAYTCIKDIYSGINIKVELARSIFQICHGIPHTINQFGLVCKMLNISNVTENALSGIRNPCSSERRGFSLPLPTHSQ